MEIKNKKKIIILASVSLVLIAAIVCGIVFWGFDDGVIKKKKKKVIVVQKGDSVSDGVDDSTDNNFSDTLFEDIDENGRVRRELYVATDNGKYVEKYVPEFTSKSVVWNGPDGYVIVYPDGDKELKKSANKLKEYILSNFKVDLKVVSDKEKSTKKEILVGETNREIKDYEKQEGKFAVRLVGEKLIFEGSHYVTINKAVDAFVSLDAKKGYVNLLDGSSDFVSTKNGYEYVWGDEFDGSILDSSKWNKDVSGDSTTTMRFLDECISVEDGRLKLYAKHYFDVSDPNVEFAVPYSITTTKTMSYKYGYLEMRARIPFQVGAWPAFWLGTEHAIGEHLNLDYEIEVDIFEGMASLDTLKPNIHKWYSSSEHTQFSSEGVKLGLKRNTFTFSNPNTINREYHIYALEWTDKEMKVYIDGKAYQTFDLAKSFDDNPDMRGLHNPMRIILSNHMFTSDAKFKPYAGCEIDARDLPLEFFVDYMRLYQKPNTGALYTGD